MDIGPAPGAVFLDQHVQRDRRDIRRIYYFNAVALSRGCNCLVCRMIRLQYWIRITALSLSLSLCNNRLEMHDSNRLVTETYLLETLTQTVFI